MATVENWVLAQLSHDERTIMLERARRRELTPGHTIFMPGDEVDAVWFPESGVVSIIITSAEGVQAEAGLTGPESGVGLLECFGSGVIASVGFVQAPGWAWVVPAADCRALHARSPTFRQAMQLSSEFQAVEGRQSLFCRSYHTAEARLARWLLEVRDRSAAPADALPMTQDVLAAMLAVQRTTVSSTAAKLVRRGAIATTRGRMAIKDAVMLESIACACRRHLKAEGTRIRDKMRSLVQS